MIIVQVDHYERGEIRVTAYEVDDGHDHADLFSEADRVESFDTKKILRMLHNGEISDITSADEWSEYFQQPVILRGLS